jgi:uncharacterized membrane protein
MRITFIDEIRGLAFLFMILHHINYFKDVSTNYKTNHSDNYIINKIGNLSRITFIILVGVGLYESYINNKDTFAEKRIKRSGIILFHAFIISIISHYLYPEYGIKFGVLHFIGVITILMIPLMEYPKLLAIIGILLYIFGKYIPQLNNDLLDLIFGTNINYSMMDYFPLIKWAPYVFMGTFLGYLFHHPEIKLFPTDIFEKLGKNSLHLYTLHVIFLLLFYYIK